MRHAKIASMSLPVCGLNALAASVTTPLAAATRRPGGGRLIVRRVKCLNPKAAGQRRGHAAVDQVFTDLINGPLNHLPSSAFEADVARPQSAATAQTPTRAVGTLPQPVTPWRAAPPSAPS